MKKCSKNRGCSKDFQQPLTNIIVVAIELDSIQAQQLIQNEADHLKFASNLDDNRSTEESKSPFWKSIECLVTPIVNFAHNIKSSSELRTLFLFRHNKLNKKEIWNMFHKIFEKSKCKWEFAESLLDFWFLIAQNVINLDIVYIFSSENIVIPEVIKNTISQVNSTFKYI